jgi:amino acid transporter
VILQRVLLAIVAATAMATAAVIALVAVAFAIFALLQPHVGPALAAAIVAGIFALLIAALGFLAAGGAGAGFGRASRVDEREAMGLADRLMDIARERPIAAVGVALALGIVLMRSPNALGAVARAFFDTFSGGRPEER